MSEFQSPIATVDVALFTLSERRLCVALARRPAQADVFAGAFALPGGYVHVDEDDDTEASARRVLATKLGLVVPYLEQLYTFSGKFRDPRGWSVSIAYYAVTPASALTGPDVRLVPVDDLPALPFDHGRIVGQAVERLRAKAGYSSLPTFLLPAKFTLDELYSVYCQVIGTDLNKVSFRRKIENQGIVAAIPGEKQHGAHRPAQMYRVAATRLKQFDQML